MAIAAFSRFYSPASPCHLAHQIKACFQACLRQISQQNGQCVYNGKSMGLFIWEGFAAGIGIQMWLHPEEPSSPK